jgi:hypothetical protein
VLGVEGDIESIASLESLSERNKARESAAAPTRTISNGLILGSWLLRLSIS